MTEFKTDKTFFIENPGRHYRLRKPFVWEIRNTPPPPAGFMTNKLVHKLAPGIRVIRNLIHTTWPCNELLEDDEYLAYVFKIIENLPENEMILV